MHMLYNSENYVVVQFELISSDQSAAATEDSAGLPQPTRGGYEIVDKFARKEIFIDGEMALTFRAGVDALIEKGGPTEDDLDAYIARYASLMQQPVVMH